MPCATVGWSNNERNSKAKRISFHCFPKDKHFQNMWIHTCKCSDNFCINYAHMCFDHFAEHDFECDLRVELLNLKFRKHLKLTAVMHIKIH